MFIALERIEIRHCLSCGLVFANPMSYPKHVTDLFENAYLGNETEMGLKRYYLRLKARKALLKQSLSPIRLFTPYKAAISFIRSNVPPRSTVLDIGCGLGLFMHELKRLGYRACGLEVSKPLVEILRQEGFEVWHGTVDTLPSNWVEPQVCTCFSVLHHLEEPLKFLITIRRKFPGAFFLVGEWITPPKKYKQEPYYPPSQMSWWQPQSLRIAMEKAGYDVEIVVLRKTGQELRILNEFSALLAVRILSKLPEIVLKPLLSLFYRIKQVLLLLRFAKEQGGYMLAIGRPRPESHIKSNSKRSELL